MGVSPGATVGDRFLQFLPEDAFLIQRPPTNRLNIDIINEAFWLGDDDFDTPDDLNDEISRVAQGITPFTEPRLVNQIAVVNEPFGEFPDADDVLRTTAGTVNSIFDPSFGSNFLARLPEQELPNGVPSIPDLGINPEPLVILTAANQAPIGLIGNPINPVAGVPEFPFGFDPNALTIFANTNTFVQNITDPSDPPPFPFLPNQQVTIEGRFPLTPTTIPSGVTPVGTPLGLLPGQIIPTQTFVLPIGWQAVPAQTVLPTGLFPLSGGQAPIVNQPITNQPLVTQPIGSIPIEPRPIVGEEVTNIQTRPETVPAPVGQTLPTGVGSGFFEPPTSTLPNQGFVDTIQFALGVSR